MRRKIQTVAEEYNASVETGCCDTVSDRTSPWRPTISHYNKGTVTVKGQAEMDSMAQGWLNA